jgi:hypothetical protein
MITPVKSGGIAALLGLMQTLWDHKPENFFAIWKKVCFPALFNRINPKLRSVNKKFVFFANSFLGCLDLEADTLPRHCSPLTGV